MKMKKFATLGMVLIMGIGSFGFISNDNISIKAVQITENATSQPVIEKSSTNKAALQKSSKKVVKIKDKGICLKNAKGYHILTGITADGTKVWKYKTKKVTFTELDDIAYKIVGNYVYLFEYGNFVKIKKDTGKVVVKKKNKVFKVGGVTFNTDKKGNAYAQGYYSNVVFKVSPKGKVLWKKDISKTGYYWAYKIKIGKNAIKVVYCGDSGSGTITYSQKNGKIISKSKKEIK